MSRFFSTLFPLRSHQPFVAISRGFRSPHVWSPRCMSTEPGAIDSASIHLEDVRSRLLAELKEAMKTKDKVKSTTIRSVLSEIYAVDKTMSSGQATPSTIFGIIRKAVARRTDAALQFEKAERPDLATKEVKEVAILDVFLPPLLSEEEIDRVLKEVLTSPSVSEILATTRGQKALGQVFKAFYAQVDKANVDADLVRQRALALTAAPE